MTIQINQAFFYFQDMGTFREWKIEKTYEPKALNLSWTELGEPLDPQLYYLLTTDYI